MIALGSEAHSDVGGSSMSRVLACPGSVRTMAAISDFLPDEPDEYSSEGTLAHEVAARRLESGRWTTEHPQMVHDLQEYVDFVERFGERPLAEWKFKLPGIHSRLHGTVDGRNYDRLNGGTALVVDLKFGAGVPVEVKNNKQLLVYALGVVDDIQKMGLPIAWVELAIVQPRYDHPEGRKRTWKISVSELSEFGRRLKRDLALVDKPSSSITAGAHCRWCRAKPVCGTYQQAAEEALGTSYAGSLPYDAGKLAQALALSETLPSWKKAVNAFAYKEALRGRPPPGWKLVPKRSKYGGYVLVEESDSREAAVLQAPGSEYSEAAPNLEGYPT